DGLDDRLVPLDIARRNGPLSLRWPVRLPDDEEPPFPDEECAHADRDRKGRDAWQHGDPQGSEQDGFLSSRGSQDARSDGAEGYLHTQGVPSEHLAARELRRVARWSQARVHGEQGGAVVRL